MIVILFWAGFFIAAILLAYIFFSLRKKIFSYASIKNEERIANFKILATKTGFGYSVGHTGIFDIESLRKFNFFKGKVLIGGVINMVFKGKILEDFPMYLDNFVYGTNNVADWKVFDCERSYPGRHVRSIYYSTVFVVKPKKHVPTSDLQKELEHIVEEFKSKGNKLVFEIRADEFLIASPFQTFNTLDPKKIPHIYLKLNEVLQQILI